MKKIPPLRTGLSRNDWLACGLSGLALALVFPPWNVTPLLGVALVPFLCRVQAGCAGRNAWRGFCMGLVFHAVLLYWLGYVTVIGTVLLSVVLAGYMALLAVVTGECRRFRAWVPLAALAWAGVEYFRSLGPFSFAWGYLGHGLYPWREMIQLAFWIGVPGLSFLVMGFNAALAAAWEHLPWPRKPDSLVVRDWRRIRVDGTALLVFTGILLGNWFHGESVMARYQNPPAGSLAIRVAVIQGNYEQDRKETASLEETLADYLNLSRQALAGAPDLIIWPESTITYPVNFWPEGVEQIQQFVDQANIELLAGTVWGNPTAQNTLIYLNQAILFSPGKAIGHHGREVDLHELPSYSKMHLVPFGEWVPGGEHWPFAMIETLIEEAGAGIFKPGDRQTLFVTRQGARFAVAICFESTLAWMWRQAKNQGADFVITITNDAWYKRSAGLEQHFSQTVFRAVENRIPAVRAANTGISGFIGPTGEILAWLPPHQAGFLTRELRLPRP
ncbi:MAG: apolipoprotein N-acyltransferase [bacterium]